MDGTFDRAGDDGPLGVVSGGMVDDAVAEERPVLHQPEHNGFSLKSGLRSVLEISEARAQRKEAENGKIQFKSAAPTGCRKSPRCRGRCGRSWRGPRGFRPSRART